MAQANGSLPKFAKRHYEAIATAIQAAALVDIAGSYAVSHSTISRLA